MTSTYVSSTRMSPKNRLSHSRLYQYPDSDSYDDTPTSDNIDSQVIGWDRRYGLLFFSETAISYGPFSVSSADDQFILSQMPRFLQERGKKCQYRIFETYTGVVMDKGGLRARRRDPATDRVYYFPSHYPNCIVLSVLHFDGDSTCAVLVYRFKTEEKAARAYTMLTETNSVPKKERTPRPAGIGSVAQLSVSPDRLSLRRTPSKRANKGRYASNRSPSRGGEKQQNVRSRIDQPSMRSSSRPSRGTSYPAQDGRRESRRSKSHPKFQVPSPSPNTFRQCCCSACGYGPQSTPKVAIKISPPANPASFVIFAGKTYPLAMFRSVLTEEDESFSEVGGGIIRPTRLLDNASSDSSSLTSSDDSSYQGKIIPARIDGSDQSSVSCESVVELVFNKLRKSPKLAGNTVFKNANKGNAGASSPTTVIRLSRQESSDDEADGVDGKKRRTLRVSSPPQVIPDGTTVYNLYGRQRYTNDDYNSNYGESL